MIMMWTLMWLNWSKITINVALQLLDIYRFYTSLCITLKFSSLNSLMTIARGTN